VNFPFCLLCEILGESAKTPLAKALLRSRKLNTVVATQPFPFAVCRFISFCILPFSFSSACRDQLARALGIARVKEKKANYKWK